MVVKKSIIPNLFTMGNMLMGFFSILFSAKYVSPFGNYDYLVVAGFLIFVGAIFDAGDGAVARALKVESEIGMQLDSFADAVTYGVAPGVLAYQAFLHQLPELFFGISSGVIAASIFPICAIYRLARFNIETGGKGFKGLPSPPAGIIAGIVPAMYSVNVLFIGEVNCEVNVYQYLVFYCFIALLMISVIDYSKLFSEIWKIGVAARIITIVVIVFLLIFAKGIAIFIVTGIYVLWGIFRYITKVFKKRRAAKSA